MIRSRAVIALSIAIPALSAPAGAQFVPHRTYPPVGVADPFLPDSRLGAPGAWQDVGSLRNRIDRARDAGLISRREARQLRRQANRISARAQIYGRDGLSSSEQAALEFQVRAVAGTISAAAAGGD